MRNDWHFLVIGFLVVVAAKIVRGAVSGWFGIAL